MQARNPVDDRQTEACSSRVGTRSLEARERALQAFDFVLRNARAPIEDVDPDRFAAVLWISARAMPDAYAARLAGRCVTYRPGADA